MLADFIEKYGSEYELPESGGLIVKSVDRFFVISPNELVLANYVFDSDDNIIPIISGITLEQQVNSAVLFVTHENIYNIYHITGHNETPINKTLRSMLKTEGYVINELDFLTAGKKIPDDCHILLITTPEWDYTFSEKEIITEYIKNSGGRLFIAVNGAFSVLPMFNEIMQIMGVGVDNSLIVEQSVDNYYPGMSPVTIIPMYPEVKNEITAQIINRNVRILTPYATPIILLEEGSSAVVPLLVTGNSSYGITDSDAKNIDYAIDYINGPFNIAVAVTQDESDFRAVIIGADSVLDDMINSAVDGGNYELILSAVNWILDKR
jgi:hypothetical protein